MSATVLGLTAILAFATNPRCGAAAPDGEFASRLAAIAIRESGGDPLVIGVNADPARGLPATSLRSTTPQEAATRAATLLAQGRSIDLGLMQINSGQLARHGLTVQTAFDACRNMAAGAAHYADDVQAVWTLAHRRYNTGSTERGAAYAADIGEVLSRVRAQQAAAPVAPAPLPQQPPGPPPPPSWDVWGQADYLDAQAATAQPAPPAVPDSVPPDVQPPPAASFEARPVAVAPVPNTAAEEGASSVAMVTGTPVRQ